MPMLPMMVSRLKRPHLLKIVFVMVSCMSINVSERAFSAPNPLTVTEYQPIEIQRAPQQPPQQQPIAKPASYLSAFESVEVMATGYTAGFESTGKSSNHPQYEIPYSGVK